MDLISKVLHTSSTKRISMSDIQADPTEMNAEEYNWKLANIQRQNMEHQRFSRIISGKIFNQEQRQQWSDRIKNYWKRIMLESSEINDRS